MPQNDFQNYAIQIVDGEQRIDIDALRKIRDEAGEDALTDEESAILAQSEMYKNDKSGDHYENLANNIEEYELNKIAQKVLDWVEWDEESREEWQAMERKAIRALGVSPNVDGGAKFIGASKVVHPLLAEACTQFSSRALSVMWPAGGPVKTAIMGSPDEEATQQAKRVENFMNYQYTELMPGAFDQTDKKLFRVPLAGSVFVKPFYDPINGITRQMIEPADFIVPYRETDLRSAQRYTERILMSKNDVKKRQVAGHYLNIDLLSPYEETHDQNREIVIDEIRATEGRDDIHLDNDNQRHTLYECYCEIDLIKYEDKNDSGRVTGIALPYVVTVDKDTQKVLSIYRNWKPNDKSKRKVIYHVHYKFSPGLGFYGYGLYHLIGGLSKTATGALRALMDAAQFSNMQGGYRSKDAGLKPGDQALAPGEWKDVDCDANELAKAFFRIPYGEPSSVLFNLLIHIEDLGKRFAGTTEALVGEGSQNTPVGTTLARIEQGGKVISAIQKRLHEAAKEEFRLVAWLNSIYMPDEYPYRVEGEDRVALRSDFDERIDVIPVSDPSFVSNAQKYFVSQIVLDLANSSPDLYDRYSVHKRTLESLGIYNIDEILPPPSNVERMGPVQVIASAMMGKPIKAFIEQDHAAHIAVCQQFLMTANKQQIDLIGAPLTAYIHEHMAMQYILDMAQTTGISIQGIMAGEQIPIEIENQVALLSAKAMQNMPKQEETPDPKLIEIQAEQRRKDAVAMSEMRRKDAMAKATIARESESQLSKLTRENEKQIQELFMRNLNG